jgi:arginyl-tRNA--protein-N-Asp/Glu arginylyltransferase
MAKDFYTEKFGDGTFSANKAKELLTTKHNFNRLFVYSIEQEKIKEVGYSIALETNKIVHYSYPFYELRTLNSELKNLGMGMMLQAILYAQDAGKKYIYLGSFQRSGDVYKLQFEGLEWFDGERWSNNLNILKELSL